MSDRMPIPEIDDAELREHTGPFDDAGLLVGAKGGHARIVLRHQLGARDSARRSYKNSNRLPSIGWSHSTRDVCSGPRFR